MFFVAGSGIVLALPETLRMTTNFLAARYKKKLERLEKKRIVIDLRTMSPKEKQASVDDARRDYETRQKNDWVPKDMTEAWIKDDSFKGESFQDFKARCERKIALEKERDNEPEPTVEHPLVPSTEAIIEDET